MQTIERGGNARRFGLLLAWSVLAGVAAPLFAGDRTPPTTRTVQADPDEQFVVDDPNLLLAAEVHACGADVYVIGDLLYRPSNYRDRLPAVDTRTQAIEEEITLMLNKVEHRESNAEDVRQFCERTRKSLDTMVNLLGRERKASFLARFRKPSSQLSLNIRRSQDWLTSQIGEAHLSDFSDMANDAANAAMDARSDEQVDSIREEYKRKVKLFASPAAWERVTARYPELFGTPTTPKEDSGPQQPQPIRRSKP